MMWFLFFFILLVTKLLLRTDAIPLFQVFIRYALHTFSINIGAVAQNFLITILQASCCLKLFSAPALVLVLHKNTVATPDILSNYYSGIKL